MATTNDWNVVGGGEQQLNIDTTLDQRSQHDRHDLDNILAGIIGPQTMSNCLCSVYLDRS